MAQPLSLEVALEQFIWAYKSSDEENRSTKLRRIVHSIPNEKRAILCGFGSLLLDADATAPAEEPHVPQDSDSLPPIQPLFPEALHPLEPLTELDDAFSPESSFNYSDNSE